MPVCATFALSTIDRAKDADDPAFFEEIQPE
jgi:hypothetical protein